MTDEIWTMHDGTRIPVSEMSEGHVRNALRMVLRKRRERAALLIGKLENLPILDGFAERPDNPTILAHLRQKHGDAVRVERKGISDMSGGNVYVADRWIGWFGGI